MMNNIYEDVMYFLFIFFAELVVSPYNCMDLCLIKLKLIEKFQFQTLLSFTNSNVCFHLNGSTCVLEISTGLY